MFSLPFQLQTNWLMILYLPWTAIDFLFVSFYLLRTWLGFLPVIFLLSLKVTLDLVKIVSLTPSLRTPLGSKRLFNIARNSVCPCWNLTWYLKGFNNFMIRNLAKLEADIWSLMGYFGAFSPKLKVPRGKEKTFQCWWMCGSILYII